MSRLREYGKLWELEQSLLRAPYAGAPARDLDLNVAFPRDWHFAGLAAYDSTRTQTVEGFWNVTTLWVQEQLRNAGYSIAADGRYGPQTAGALLSFIRDRLRQPVIGFTPGNMASIQQAIERLPDAYSFGVYAEGDRMSLSTLLERYLEPIQPPPPPRPGSGSPSPSPPPLAPVASGSGMADVLLPLAFVAAGLIFLFRPER